MIRLHRTPTLAAILAATLAAPLCAEDIKITVWALAGDADSHRVDAIAMAMAADILEREAAVRGETLDITVDGKRDFSGWDEFKQAVTLGAEAGTAPAIVVTGHLDIAPWSQARYIVPVEDYLDLDAWPLSNVYPNLMDIASFGGVQWGIPRDAESRPFLFWKDTMKKTGYSDADLDALPGRVQSGENTLQNMLEDAKKATEMGLVEPGYGWYPRVSNGPDYAQFYQSFGGTLADPETGKLVLDRAAMTAFYQFFADSVAAGVTRKTNIGTDWDQWYAEVAIGKALFWHGGTWHYANYTGKQGNTDFFGTIGFSLIPAGAEGGKPNTITHPLVYLVTKQADERVQEVAAQLIAIATEPRPNSLHAIKSAHLAVAEAQAGIELYSGDRWASEATTVLLPHANSQPNHVKYGAYSETMWKGLEAVWTGVQTPDQAVSELEAGLTAALGDELIVR